MKFLQVARVFWPLFSNEPYLVGRLFWGMLDEKALLYVGKGACISAQCLHFCRSTKKRVNKKDDFHTGFHAWWSMHILDVSTQLTVW